MGNYLDFDGVDDNVSLGDTLDISGTTFTFLCWMRRSATQVTHLIRRSTTSSTQYAVRVNTSGQIEFEFGGVVTSSGAAGVFSDNQWRQVGVSYDGTTVRFVVDGVITAFNRTGNITSVIGAVTTIGSNTPQTGTIEYSMFSVDTARIYDVVVTDLVISSLYQSERSPFLVPTTEKTLALETVNVLLASTQPVLALEQTRLETGIATPSSLKAFLEATGATVIGAGQILPRE